MSTRCVINFCWDTGKEVVAKIYRHSDGYPDGVLPDLQRFFEDVKKQTGGDTRFNDPCYLSAKFVVWQAGEYAAPRAQYSGDPADKVKKGDNPHMGSLNFLSVGVCLKNPGDIEYQYWVKCDGKGPTPSVTHRKA